MNIQSMIRVGVVSDRSVERCAVRVIFEGQDQMVSDWLPVVQPLAGRARFFALPDVGDSVICLFLGTGLETGFCAGMYYAGGAVPAASGNTIGVWLPGGNYVELDQSTGSLAVQATGGVSITAPAVSITGNLSVSGSITRGGVSI